MAPIFSAIGAGEATVHFLVFYLPTLILTYRLFNSFPTGGFANLFEGIFIAFIIVGFPYFSVEGIVPSDPFPFSILVMVLILIIVIEYIFNIIFGGLLKK